MSLKAMNWCIEQKDLPPGEWIVLFHLCHCHNHETGRCDPSQEYIADMTGMGVRTVRRHLAALEDRGRITRKKRGIEGGGRLSDYYILAIEPAKMAANVTGQSMRTNRPIHAEKVHEMAAKQGRNREGTGKTPIVPASDFDEFYAACPRKVGKDAARKAYAKALTKTDHATLMAGIRRYAEERRGKDAQYTAHPASWLNAGRWADEPESRPDEFHRQVEMMLRGETDELRGPDARDRLADQRIPDRLEAPRAPDAGRGHAENAGDGGSYQQAVASLLRPRRLGAGM
jgi:hypothetical protein